MLLWGVQITAIAQDRQALIIGNSEYEEKLALRNPANDAADISKALESLGFNVATGTNLDLGGMEKAVIDFRRNLKKGDVAFFFYAGHGIEVNGTNYLVPLKSNIREAFEVKRKALEVGYVLDALDESEANLKIVVLDCCRDNPLKRSWSRSTGGDGLAAMTVPEGTILAYSTAPNSVALDGSGRNSPYSKHLIQVLGSRPELGLEIKQLFFTASLEVKREFGQTPWLALEASLEPFYLWTPTAKSVASVPSTPPPPVEPGPSMTPRKVVPIPPRSTSSKSKELVDQWDTFRSIAEQAVVLTKAGSYREVEKLIEAGFSEKCALDIAVEKVSQILVEVLDPSETLFYELPLSVTASDDATSSSKKWTDENVGDHWVIASDENVFVAWRQEAAYFFVYREAAGLKDGFTPVIEKGDRLIAEALLKLESQ